jgi:hypothetical protein
VIKTISLSSTVAALLEAFSRSHRRRRVGRGFGRSPTAKNLLHSQSRLLSLTRASDGGFQGAIAIVREGKTMTSPWTDLPDDQLAKIAQDGLQGQGAPVEAMRRLRIAIERASAESDKYSRRMYWLTVVVTLLTLVQVAALLPPIWDWWSKVGPAIWALVSHG